MRPIEINKELVAYCGLYCGACKKYMQNKCPGCNLNEKASWCKVRSCCIAESYSSCAGCKVYEDPNDCKKFHNPISMLFAFVFKSDRAACIKQIKDMGLEAHAKIMAGTGRQTIKK